MRLPSLSHVIAFIALPLVAHAEPIDECDRLAALEADPTAVSKPVAFIDIQPERVVKACSDALMLAVMRNHGSCCSVQEAISGAVRRG